MLRARHALSYLHFITILDVSIVIIPVIILLLVGGGVETPDNLITSHCTISPPADPSILFYLVTFETRGVF